MTRKEEIEKQAFAVHPIIMETLIPLCADHEEVKQDCNQFIRKAYINGIEWADEHPRKGLIDINKACKFLEDHLQDDKDEMTTEPFINFVDACRVKETFISIFRKAMEE